MFQRIYVEIGNLCNLRCTFCPPVKRPARRMTPEEFTEICRKLRPHTDYLYLHVMGEPLCHPQLDTLLSIAGNMGFRVCITTNGTLLGRCGDMLLSHAKDIHRVSVSLHAIEGNGAETSLSAYLASVIGFARAAAAAGIYSVFRLWNLDSEEGAGANRENRVIEDTLRREFPGEWQRRWSGFRLDQNIFLEYAGLFTWPGESEAEAQSKGTCHGLLDQIAVLADGTVVPCCLDSEGAIPLGNLFTDELDAILASERAVRMREGFRSGCMVEPLCQSCTYARRFSK